MPPETRFHPAAILATLRGRWRALFRGHELDRELDEELQFHLDRETEQHLAAGMSPAEARRAALLAFGGVTRVVEAQRDARGVRVFEDLVADLRHATRSLARTPGFVAVSVATLATAIAAGTMLFTGAAGFFYRPLPVPGGAGLLAIFTSDYNGRAQLGASSYPDLLDFAEAAAPLAEVFGEGRASLGITVGDATIIAQGALVSPGYFQALQVRPALGAFPGAGALEFPVVVISHTLWRRTFGADTTLVGRSVLVNGQPFTVVAVAAAGFSGTSREQADDFWIEGRFAPLVMPRDDPSRSRTARRFHVLARLRDGVSAEALQARLGLLATELFERDPEAWGDASGEGRVVVAQRERDAHLAGIPAADRLLIIGGVAALGLGLLAIAAANLASLQLARGESRRQEIATRLALGAGRGRIIRQLLAECALVVTPGVMAGVMLAAAGAALVAHYRPIPLPSIDLSLDLRALAFIAGGLVLALVVFGLLPALQSVRPDLLTDLKGGHQPGAAGLRIGGMRGSLIVGQAALAILFTALSGMVALALVRHAALGREDARQVLVAQVNFLPAAGDSTAVGTLTAELLANLAALPGVAGASVAEFIPVRGRRRTVEAALADEHGEVRRLELDANGVTPGYFGVVGLPVLRGRAFEPRDAGAPQPALVVSRAMADALWPGTNPIGQRIEITTRRYTGPAEVVGVVADPPGAGPATPASFPGLLYLPLAAEAEAEVVLHLRATGSPGALAGLVLQRLRSEGGRLATPEVMTLERYHDDVVLPQRLLARAAAVLAAFQLLLAAAGLSGLVAYVTALRRREVGIRTALGASRASILRLVMRQGIRLTVGGGLFGIGGTLLLGRVVATTLPVTGAMVAGALAAGVATFLVAGLLAMWLPARRALAVPPAVVLRVD